MNLTAQVEARLSRGTPPTAHLPLESGYAGSWGNPGNSEAHCALRGFGSGHHLPLALSCAGTAWICDKVMGLSGVGGDQLGTWSGLPQGPQTTLIPRPPCPHTPSLRSLLCPILTWLERKRPVHMALFLWVLSAGFYPQQ